MPGNGAKPLAHTPPLPSGMENYPLPDSVQSRMDPSPMRANQIPAVALLHPSKYTAAQRTRRGRLHTPTLRGRSTHCWPNAIPAAGAASSAPCRPPKFAHPSPLPASTPWNQCDKIQGPPPQCGQQQKCLPAPPRASNTHAVCTTPPGRPSDTGVVHITTLLMRTPYCPHNNTANADAKLVSA